MRNKTRKLISTLLTLAMLVSLITVMPITASAWDSTDLTGDSDASTIDLADIMDALDHGEDITEAGWNWAYGYFGNTILVMGNVTVVGTVTNATEGLYITIASGTTATWTADYKGSVGAGDSLISITQPTTSSAFYMTGGTIENTGTGTAVKANDTNGNIYATTGKSTIYGTVEVGRYLDAFDGGELVIYGDVLMSQIAAGTSLTAAEDPGIIRITGDVTLKGDNAHIGADDGGLVDIKGDVLVEGDGAFIFAGGPLNSTSGVGAVNIKGNVTFAGESSFIVACGTPYDFGGILSISGDVEFTNVDTSGCHIALSGGGKIYLIGANYDGIDGIDVMIWDDTDFRSNPPIKTLSVGTPTSLTTLASPYDGYYWDEYTFNDGSLVKPQSYLYIRQGAVPPTPSGGGGGGGAAPTYTVTFVTNGGSAVASGKVAANGKLTKPADPTREGYDFAGWYTNAGLTTPYDFDSSVTQGFTLYAKWTEKGPTPVTPEMPVNPFTDVKGTDWFIDDVIYAYDKGLIDGTSPTTFSPNSNLTYAQAITLAARMHQLYTKGEITLENGDDPWYQSYVDYAIENGIISGDYDWGAMATRAGYMQIFANALPNDAFAAINSVPDGSIPDVPMDYPGAAAIYKLYRAGILQGNDDTHKCSPDNNIRRSEVAAILTRMMNPDARISFSM